jgi:hypothetical protein
VSALNPLFFLAGLAIAVPIFLHLFQKHETRRFSFPALRYLVRTEREHARQIRVRQLLLLFTRVAVLLLVVGAGARLVLPGRSGAHPPTAVALVLDNSLSTGLVLEETRVFDQLKTLAVQTLEGASAEDRFWVIRAGEPWGPAIAGGVAEARAAIRETEVSAAAGDLTAALRRAAELLATTGLAHREIHLLSDLQRTAFMVPGSEPAGDVPVVVWAPEEDETAPNRAITGLLVGGGLPPVEGQRAEVAVRALDTGTDTARWTVRLVVGDRVRGAASLSSGAETVMALPPSGAGWVQGYVEADPDALRADDRRYFAYRSRPAPAVHIAGSPPLFLAEAIAVLERSSRLALTAPDGAELVVAQDGADLELRGPAAAALVVPPEDATLLPALNRRLAGAGIAWRYEVRTASGEVELEGEALPSALRGVRVRNWLALHPTSVPPPPSRALAEAAGTPWALEGTDAAGRRYLLLASPLVPEASSLPVSAGMVRFMDWAATEWAAAGNVTEYFVGDHLPAPAGATRVRFPSGREADIDATRTVRGTGEAGIYAFLAGDSLLAAVALNPPPAESELARLDRRELDRAIGRQTVMVSSADAWSRSVYRSRFGFEAWWPFLLAATLLLLAESLLASGNRLPIRGGPRRALASEASGAVP